MLTTTATLCSSVSMDASHTTMSSCDNRQVLNYTSTGFLKIKAPPEVFKLVTEFWEQNKDEQSIEWSNANPYRTYNYASDRFGC